MMAGFRTANPTTIAYVGWVGTAVLCSLSVGLLAPVRRWALGIPLLATLTVALPSADGMLRAMMHAPLCFLLQGLLGFLAGLVILGLVVPASRGRRVAAGAVVCLAIAPAIATVAGEAQLSEVRSRVLPAIERLAAQDVAVQLTGVKWSHLQWETAYWGHGGIYALAYSAEGVRLVICGGKGLAARSASLEGLTVDRLHVEIPIPAADAWTRSDETTEEKKARLRAAGLREELVACLAGRKSPGLSINCPWEGTYHGIHRKLAGETSTQCYTGVACTGTYRGDQG